MRFKISVSLFILAVVFSQSESSARYPLLQNGLESQQKPEGVIDFLWYIWKGVQDVIHGRIPFPGKCTECFKFLGCFDACNGTFHYIHLLPETPEQIGTKFMLYPWYDNNTEILLDYTNITSLNRTIFSDTNRGLLIVNHGFYADADSDWMVDLKNIVIEHRKQNVILVDWTKGADPYDLFYPLAVVNTELVGRQVAALLHGLMSKYALKPATIHYVGHSLGAQTAHFFSLYFSKISGGIKIRRITALDAASPLYEAYGVGINNTDAMYVEAIHTSAGDNIFTGKLGVVHPVGHVDFYANGGTYQPGCWRVDLVCAHKRSHVYYVEAVTNQLTQAPCTYRSYSCENGRDGYLNGTCFPNERNYSRISYDLTDTQPGDGMQYIDTNSSSPFCKQ